MLAKLAVQPGAKDIIQITKDILDSIQGLLGPLFAIVVFIIILKTISKKEFTIVGALIALGGAILVWVVYANFLEIAGAFNQTFLNAKND